MTEATTRPWHARAPIDDLDATINGESVGPVPATICRVYRNDDDVHCTRFIAEIYNGDTDEGAANAALIVRAVNNYDVLMDALEKVTALTVQFQSEPARDGFIDATKSLRRMGGEQWAIAEIAHEALAARKVLVAAREATP